MRACPLYCVLVALLLTATTVGQQRLPGFGTDRSRLPGFGEANRTGLPLTDKDRAEALSAIKKVDSNNDGIMSRDELRNSRYQKYEERRFAYDANRDNRLTETELANYYAKIRLDKLKASRDKQDAARKQQEAARKQTEAMEQALRDQLVAVETLQAAQVYQWHVAEAANMNDLVLQLNTTSSRRNKLQRVQLAFAQENGSFVIINGQGSVGAAQAVIRRYDENGDGILQYGELSRIEGGIKLADSNRDGSVNLQELAKWLDEQTADQYAGAQDWFKERDANQDGQVSMQEFASVWTSDKLTAFNQMDRDSDGIITAAERVAPTQPKALKFTSGPAAVIVPVDGVSSAIDVEEDFQVADVNVRISILHTAPEQLSAVLVSPGGRRVQLFNGKGKNWKGNNFEDTLFDDDAAKSVDEAMPPFHGTLKPTVTESKEGPGLASFQGERSRGPWRLYVLADRSNRAGLLDNWSLELLPARRPSGQLGRTGDHPQP